MSLSAAAIERDGRLVFVRRQWATVLRVWVIAGCAFAAVSLVADYDSMDRLRPVFGVVTIALAVASIRAWRPVPARPWWFLVAGLAANVLGDALTGGGAGQGSLGTLGSLAYILAYPLCLAAVAGLLGRAQRRRDAAIVVDAVVFAMAVWLLVWLALVWPALEGHGIAATEWVPTVLYVPLDVLLLVVLARVGHGDQRANRTWRLLLVGVAAMSVADLCSVWSLVPAAGDVRRLGAAGWALAYTAIGAALLLPDLASLHRDTRHELTLPHAHLRFIGLGLALAVPPVLLIAVADAPAETTVVALVQLAMIAAVVFRAWLTVDAAADVTDTLNWRATHDPLTGLLNREAFLVELESARRRAARGVTGSLLLFVDLDGFKAVNDDFGHEAGDALLVEVARRLREAVRVEDRVGRFGGDEFVVICEYRAVSEDAAAAARRIEDVLREPYEVQGVALRVGASVGWTDAVATARDCDELLRRADESMFREKAAHRRRGIGA